MATDAQNDVQWMQTFTGYPNSYFFPIWNEFANPEAWDGYSCSEIACCVSYKAGNLGKIQVSNYAQGLVNLFTQYLSVGNVPKVGAFIFFDYHDGEGISHTGRVMWYDSNYVHTFEGNVGGLTIQRDWLINDSAIALYGYPAYTDEDTNSYNVRTQTPEGENLPEYNTVSSGGWNSNTTGFGAVSGADVLYSDGGYAQGRLIEINNRLFADATTQSHDVSPTLWVQGGIGSTGKNTGVLTRVRTQYINFPNDYQIQFTIPSGFRGYMFEYSSNDENTFIQRIPTSGWITSNQTRTIRINPNYYYRWCMGNNSNTNLTPSDFNNALHIDGYYADYPVTDATHNKFSIFVNPVSNWLTIATSHGYSISNNISAGCMCLWHNQTTDEWHVAIAEQYVNGKWYVSQSYNDKWTYSYLINDAQHTPLELDGQGFAFMGCIIPYVVPYPPVAPIPPTGDKFTYKPYFRHMRRMRGS